MVSVKEPSDGSLPQELDLVSGPCEGASRISGRVYLTSDKADDVGIQGAVLSSTDEGVYLLRLDAGGEVQYRRIVFFPE